MTEPFIFIGTHRLKEGRTEAYKESLPEFLRTVQDNEPRLLHFGAYFSEDGTEVRIVQIHPDAASMAHHMQVVRTHITTAYRDFLVETKEIQIYGKADQAVLETISGLAGAGVPVRLRGDFRGFSRLPSERSAGT